MESAGFKPALHDLVNAVPVVVGDDRWDVCVLGLAASGTHWLVNTAVVGPHTRTFTIPVPRTLTVRAMAKAILDGVVDRMVDAQGGERAAMLR